jgi:hypothetical protein
MNWKISKDIPDGPEGFPFAIISGKSVRDWVEKKNDAKSIVDAPSEIARLSRERSRYKTMWLAALATRRHG